MPDDHWMTGASTSPMYISPSSPVESETEELLVTANLADATTTIVATALPFALALRALAGRSVTIERLDGSAASLYPVVREEAEPPRWRVSCWGRAAPRARPVLSAEPCALPMR